MTEDGSVYLSSMPGGHNPLEQPTNVNPLTTKEDIPIVGTWTPTEMSVHDDGSTTYTLGQLIDQCNFDSTLATVTLADMSDISTETSLTQVEPSPDDASLSPSLSMCSDSSAAEQESMLVNTYSPPSMPDDFYRDITYSS
jgi:hypothetical protein